MKINVYGCRGSIPYARGVSEFGGNTSCMSIRTGNDELIFDAGSGLYSLLERLRRDYGPNFDGLPVTHILLSHLHLDHVIGLGMFAPAWSGFKVRIYTLDRGCGSLKEQVLGLFAPPYWPVDMKKLPNTEIVEIEPDVPFQIGCFTVTAFTAEHPDGTLSFHVTDGENSFVHLLDSEYPGESSEEQPPHMRYLDGADLVVFDACYMPGDYFRHKGWGHSTVLHGIEFSRRWNVKRMMFSHFAQAYTDAQLRSLAEHFGGDTFLLAKDNMELEL